MLDTKARTKQLLRSAMLSLWFIWLLVTIGDLATLSDSGFADQWNYIPNALFDVFTPKLLFTQKLMVHFKPALSGIALVVLFLGLFFGNLLGKQIQVKGFRFVYNLLFLVVLTTAIDMINWGHSYSFSHLAEAYNCVAIKPKPEWCPVRNAVEAPSFRHTATATNSVARSEQPSEALTCTASNDCALISTPCCGDYAVNNQYRSYARATISPACEACLSNSFVHEGDDIATCNNGRCSTEQVPSK